MKVHLGMKKVFFINNICFIIFFLTFAHQIVKLRNFMENISENNVFIEGEALSSEELRKMIVFSEIINRKEY
jgi:tellurite resistance protein TehA-like permease